MAPPASKDEFRQGVEAVLLFRVTTGLDPWSMRKWGSASIAGSSPAMTNGKCPLHHASHGPPSPASRREDENQNTSQPGKPQEISLYEGKLVMIWQPSLVTTTSSSMRAAPEPSSAPFQVSSANTMPSLSGVFWPV